MRTLNGICILFATVFSSSAGTPTQELASRLVTAQALIVDARYPEAVKELMAAVTITNSLEKQPQVRGAVFMLLGIAYQESGLTSQAEYCYRRSIQILESGPPSETMVRSVVLLGALYMSDGRHKKAEKLPVARLIADLEFEGRESVGLAGLLETTALLHAAAGRLGQADLLFRKSLDVWRRTVGPQHLDTAICLTNFGVAFARSGRYVDAASLLQQAVAILDRLDRDGTRTLSAVLSLADTHLAMKQHSDATMLYQRALDTIDRRFGSTHPHTC